jgi:hypothetical protein
MINVTVNYNPRLSRAEKELIALPNRLSNLRPLMQKGIAPEFNEMMRRHWESKGAAFGHAWAPLAPSTIAAKTRRGTVGKGILRDSDHLFKAVFRARATDDRLKMVAGGIRFQGNVAVPYAIFHQVGTQFMAERQVIPDPLPRSFKATVRAIIRTYAQTGQA